MRARRSLSRAAWLLASVVATGSGIWTMHFVAMLDCRFPFPASYDINITLLSLALAVLGCGASLSIVATGPPQPARLIGGGMLTGVGIASMHYTGMAAMKLIPAITYDT